MNPWTLVDPALTSCDEPFTYEGIVRKDGKKSEDVKREDDAKKAAETEESKWTLTPNFTLTPAQLHEGSRDREVQRGDTEIPGGR